MRERERENWDEGEREREWVADEGTGEETQGTRSEMRVWGERWTRGATLSADRKEMMAKCANCILSACIMIPMLCSQCKPFPLRNKSCKRGSLSLKIQHQLNLQTRRSHSHRRESRRCSRQRILPPTPLRPLLLGCRSRHRKQQTAVPPVLSLGETANQVPAPVDAECPAAGADALRSL